MSIFKSGNPALREKYFEALPPADATVSMTERGTLRKFFFLFLMVMGAASFTWSQFEKGTDISSWVMGAALAGFVTALIICFRPATAKYIAPAYGLFEGVFLGGISAIYNAAFAKVAPNLISQAVALTFGVVLAMYLAYRFGWLRASNTFRKTIITATAGIAIFYLLALVLNLFGIAMPYLHDSSPIGIGISLVITAVAALNLILDFDTIEQGVAQRAPKEMEWFAAFGLLVTIVWLYMEVLRLLSKLNRR